MRVCTHYAPTYPKPSPDTKLWIAQRRALAEEANLRDAVTTARLAWIDSADADDRAARDEWTARRMELHNFLAYYHLGVGC